MPYKLHLTNRNGETTTRDFDSLAEALKVMDLLGRTGLFTRGAIWATGAMVWVECRGW